MFVINCFLAVIVSMFIVDFNSCAVFFRTHDDLSEHSNYLEFSDQYRELYKQFSRLCDQWHSVQGVCFAKVCLAIATFIDFSILPVISIILNPPQSTVTRNLTLAIPTIIPTIILHLFVWYMNKLMKDYRDYQYKGKGQGSIFLPASVISNIIQYSYIENINEVNRFYASGHSRIDIMKLRIAQMERSVSISQKHMAKWLMFSSGFAVFSLFVVFIFGIGIIT